MGQNIAQKIISKHLVEGEMQENRQVSIKIDQTLTQDATGTMAYLQFRPWMLIRSKPNFRLLMLITTRFNQDLKMQMIINLCKVLQKNMEFIFQDGQWNFHQIHLERFAKPGKTLLGSDSHTPTAGGIGMLAIGAGGLDVAVAMAGGPYFITMLRLKDKFNRPTFAFCKRKGYYFGSA